MIDTSGGPRIPGGNVADPGPIANDGLNVLKMLETYAPDPTELDPLKYKTLKGRWGPNWHAGTTLNLTDNNTNYVVVERSTGTPTASTSTTNWDNLGAYARVWKRTLSGGAISGDNEDHRGGPGGVHGQSATVVSGPVSSTDNTLPRFDGTGGNQLQGSGVAVSDNDEISGYKGNINFQTGTSYTLQASDTGKVIDMLNAGAITLDMPNNLAVGFCCTVVQSGAGAITFTPASGATRRNRQSHTKSAGQWAMCVLEVRANSGGSAAEYVLGGDTAA